VSSNYVAWKFWLDVAQLLGIVAVGLYSWWSNRSKATQKRFNRHDSRLGSVEVELDHIKQAVEQRGPCQLHGQFDKRLRLIEGGVEKIDGRMQGVGNSLDLIQQHLMKH